MGSRSSEVVGGQTRSKGLPTDPNSAPRKSRISCSDLGTRKIPQSSSRLHCPSTSTSPSPFFEIELRRESKACHGAMVSVQVTGDTQIHALVKGDTWIHALVKGHAWVKELAACVARRWRLVSGVAGVARHTHKPGRECVGVSVSLCVCARVRLNGT